MAEKPDFGTGERWDAINRLASARVFYRPDDETFYISQRGVEVKEGGSLVSPTQSGHTPEEAVEEWWEQHTAGSPVLVLNAGSDSRREVRWNPFTEDWRPVNEPMDVTHLLGGALQGFTDDWTRLPALGNAKGVL